MQLTFWPLPAAHPLSARQQAAIRQVVAMFAPGIFLVPLTCFRRTRSASRS